MSKIIGTFETTASVYFNPDELRRCINKHLLGQENCNVYDKKTDSWVPINHPNIEEVKNVHQKMFSNVTVRIQADLDENGNLLNFRINK